MQSQYTKSIDVRRQPEPPHKPMNLRVRENDGNKVKSLSVQLPASLNPSEAGLGDLVGVAVAVADFDVRLRSYAPIDAQWFRLCEDRGDAPTIYRTADALTVMRAIWAEVQQTCLERQIDMGCVELL